MLICWLTICDVTCSLETSMPGKCGWRPAFRGGPRHLVEHRGPTWSGGKDVGRSISSKLGECCPSLVTTGPLILCWYDGKKIENRIGSEWADIWISVFFFPCNWAQGSRMIIWKPRKAWRCGCGGFPWFPMFHWNYPYGLLRCQVCSFAFWEFHHSYGTPPSFNSCLHRELISLRL